MTCTNGRPSLSADQDRMLFTESAGTCLLGGESLFPLVPSGTRSISIAERAHIIGHSSAGPRGDKATSEAERADPTNIVLLCPSCHTMIDKAEGEYPASTLLSLKESRRAAVALIGGAPTFRSRDAARSVVTEILQRTRAVFEAIGPVPSDGSLPTAEAATRWSREVRDTIVPNLQVVVAIVAANRDLASPEDRATAERLRLHAADLLRKHSDIPLDGPAMRFPREANDLFA